MHSDMALFGAITEVTLGWSYATCVLGTQLVEIPST